MNISDIEKAVLHLPIRERAHLAQKLLESVDQPSENEIQHMWLLEAKRRADEIDCGTVELVSGNQLDTQVQTLVK